MADLARFWGQGPVSLTKIAQEEGLSREYLEQIMMSLRHKGLVKSQRGAQGGYTLTRRPEKINFREIIQALEGEIAPVFCVSEKGELICPSEKFCSSKKVWQKIQNGFLKALDSISLKEALS